LSAALLSPCQVSSRLPPAAAKRNPYVELEQDLLPGGVPNTPWRRLLLRIKNTWTLRQLLDLYAANRYKTAVFDDKHRTALFNRIPSLIYYRCAHGLQRCTWPLRLYRLNTPDAPWGAHL
jgi:hypothetical protein